jgi:drug/metabolite transporter (DMT)-like permease
MHSLSESTRGRWLVLAAAVLWSINGLFVKSPLFATWPDEYRGMLLGVWRAAFAVVVLIPLVRRPRFSLPMVPMALSFFGMSGCFLQSMVWTTAANAIWLQNMAPAWLCLFTWLAGEKTDRRDLTTLGFAACGIGLILFCEIRNSKWDDTALWGVLLGVVSGLFYASIIHFLRRLRDFDSGWLVVVNLTTTALLLSPTLPLTGVWPAGVQWPVLAAFGMLQLGLAYFCFARGIQKISGQEAAGIALLEPVLVPIWVLLRYGEVPRWWTTTGGALILVGLAWRYLPRPGK